MPTHSLARMLRRRDFGQHLRISCCYTGKVHHFAQPDNAGPCHRFGDVFGADLVACGLHAGRGWRTGWHLRPDVYGLHQGFVMHQSHARQAKDIGDLVGVCEHAGGAVWNNSGGKFRRCEHAAFDVHVTITEAWDHISPVGIDNFGLGTNAVACIRHHTGNASMFDCNVVIWQRLARVDVDPDTAAYDGIRRCATRSNIDEGWGGGGPRWEKGMFHILLDQKTKACARAGMRCFETDPQLGN